MPNRALPQKLQDAIQTRSEQRAEFEIRSEGPVDRKERLVRLSFSSDRPIDHGGFFVVLKHDKKSANLSRLNDGGAFLDMHNWDRQIGAFVKDTVGFGTRNLNGESFTVSEGTVKVSRNQIGEEYLNDAEDGIRTKISVGFYITSAKLIESGDESGDVYECEWEALEASSVSVPADVSVGLGRSERTEPKDVLNAVKTEQTERSSAMTPEELKAQQDEIRNTAKQVFARTKDNRVNEEAMKALSEGVTADQFKSRILPFMLDAEGARAVTQEPGIGMKPKEVKRYSLVRAMNLAAEGLKIDGLEGEASAEVARVLGKTAKGFFIPYEIMRSPLPSRLDLRLLSPYKRDAMNVGNLVDGGYLVDTTMMSMIEMLRNKPKLAQMGAQVLTGLIGDVAFPKQTSGATTYFLSETQEVTKSKAQFGQLALKPKRMATAVEYSKKLLAQSSLDVESFVRADIAISQALALDLKGLIGSGNENEPTGIMNTTGITTTAIGANGGAPTFAHSVLMETAVSDENADEGSMGYLTTPGVRGKWKTTEEFTSTGIRVWQNNMTDRGAGMVNGYTARVTNQMPKTFVKGNSGAVCHGILFGAFSQFMMALWDGMDVVVDPYTGKLTGVVGIVVEQFVDAGCRQPKAFNKIVDATVS